MALKLDNLGALVGVQTRQSGGKPPVTQAQTNTKTGSKRAGKAVNRNHMLPAGSFDGSRLQKVDAEVKLKARQLKVPAVLPLESMHASLGLKDSLVKLSALEFSFAGGLRPVLR